MPVPLPTCPGLRRRCLAGSWVKSGRLLSPECWHLRRLQLEEEKEGRWCEYMFFEDDVGDVGGRWCEYRLIRR